MHSRDQHGETLVWHVFVCGSVRFGISIANACRVRINKLFGAIHGVFQFQNSQEEYRLEFLYAIHDARRMLRNILFGNLFSWRIDSNVQYAHSGNAHFSSRLRHTGQFKPQKSSD